VSLYQVGETWYVYITHNGERIRRSAGTSDKKAAQRYHDELKASLWAQTARPSGKTWADACIAWLTAAERSESDRYSLRALEFTDRAIIHCTVDDLEDAIGPKAPATFNRIATIINAILQTAVEKGWLEKAPRIKKREVKAGDYRFLTLEEWQRLLAELPEHLKAPARFAIATGLRQANVLGLQWNKVDLVRRVAWVRPEDTKSNKPIGIPLSDDAVAVLREQIGKHTEWVFPYKGRGRKEGGPVGKIKTAWHLALERAGLGRYKRWETPDGKKHKKWEGDVDWHTFRHTFASWHVMSGTPLEVLQKLGGWSDLRMVMRYAHLAPDYVAQYANNAKPWSQQAAMGMAQTVA
jgi:integrase